MKLWMNRQQSVAGTENNWSACALWWDLFKGNRSRYISAIILPAHFNLRPQDPPQKDTRS
jgi:hypothetical protein